MIACRTIHIGTRTVGTKDSGRRVIASEPGSAKTCNSEPGADNTPSTIAATRSSMPKAFHRCSTALLREAAPKPWQPPRRNARKSRARRIVDAYFSRDHFDDRESCCPLIALPSDVARGGDTVKAAYPDVMEKLLALLQADLVGPRARERALSLVALCVGGVVAARSVADPVLSQELRRAAYRRAQTVLEASSC